MSSCLARADRHYTCVRDHERCEDWHGGQVQARGREGV